jgi:hypothetical protein
VLLSSDSSRRLDRRADPREALASTALYPLPNLESKLRKVSALLVPFARNIGEIVFWSTRFIADSSLPAKLIGNKANVLVWGFAVHERGDPMLRQYKTSTIGNNLRWPHPIMGKSN